MRTAIERVKIALMAMRNVLITGGTGFLGVHLARTLLATKKYHVTLFDIAPLDAKDLIGKVTYIKGDVRKSAVVKKAINGMDYIVHAAAALPLQHDRNIIYQTNIIGTENVLEASLQYKIKRLVYISSSAVYGVPKYVPETEKNPIDPVGYYGESKVASEKLCQEYMRKGLQINIIRPKTFLGPERLGVFQLWFEAIYSGKHVFLLGSGNNRYQLLDVGDISDAIIKALEEKVHGEAFNVGAKKFGTWREDLGAVIKYAKSKSTIIGLPVLPSQIILSLLEYFHLSPIVAWHYKTIPVESYLSIAKAEKLLQWHPKKSNKELLLESYQWYEKHRNEIINRKGMTHRVGWNFQLINLITKFF